jgi:hypothetical protein
MADDDLSPPDSGGWMDNIKRTVGGLFSPPPEGPRPKILDSAKWNSVFDDAKMAPDDPNRRLFQLISDHYNNAPIPREPSTAQKGFGVVMNALGAGLLRRAGASPEGSQAATQAMIGDWRDQSKRRDEALLGLSEKSLGTALPLAQTAIQTAENRRILAAQAAANRARIFGETPAASPTAAPGGPPAAAPPAGTPPAPAAAASAPPAPGATPVSATPGTTPAMTAQVPDPANPAGAGNMTAKTLPIPEPDRPAYQLGNGPHFFYTKQWRDTADTILRGNIDNNALVGMGLKAVDPSKSKEGQAEDVLMQLKKADEAAHQASPAYKANTRTAEEYASKRVAAGMDAKGKIDVGAESAQNANRTLDLMRAAYQETKKSGVLGPGFATAWLTNLNNAADRLGLPHMATAPIQMINELSNRMGIESMMEEMSAGNGVKGGGQRMFLAFREAVANTSQNPEGFEAIMEAMQALNNMHIARQKAANEWLGEMEKRGQTPILDHHAQGYIEQAAQDAFKQAMPAVQRVISPYVNDPNLGKGQPGQPGQAAAAPPLSKDEMRAAVSAAIAKSGGKLSVPDAMDQVTAEHNKAAGAAPAQPGATAPTTTGSTPAPAADERPKSPLTRKLYDWMYPDPKQKKKELDDIRRSALGPGISTESIQY